MHNSIQDSNTAAKETNSCRKHQLLCKFTRH